jgi:hypothetical protein
MMPTKNHYTEQQITFAPKQAERDTSPAEIIRKMGICEQALLSQLPPSSVTIGYLHWPAFLAISLAGIICTPFVAKLATILPAKILQKTFAICMFFIGLKMLF